MGKFVLDPCVEDELDAIWDYIAEDNPDAATRVVEAAYATFRMLACNPLIGRARKFKDSRLIRVPELFIRGRGEQGKAPRRRR